MSFNYTKVFVYRIAQKFPDPMGKILKRVLSCLYRINYVEINICHSDVQKHVSHEKWLK